METSQAQADRTSVGEPGPFTNLSEAILAIGDDLQSLVNLNYTVSPSNQFEVLLSVHRQLQTLLAKK
jgi:hypothetical protein